MAFGANRPRMLMCYVCGREYGTKSLPIHIPQCIKKWEEAEAQKPPKERRKLPRPPVGSDPNDGVPIKAGNVDAFNAAAFASYEENSLERCPNCDRTFNYDAFKKHQNLCTPDKPFKPRGTALGKGAAAVQIAANAVAQVALEPSMAASVRPKPVARPVTAPASGPLAYTCYICGNQFGSSSLFLHLPQCQKQWVAAEEAKGTLRPVPLMPAEMPATALELPKDAATVNTFNAIMSSHYNMVSLVACAGCGRTFRPEALALHAPSCTGRVLPPTAAMEVPAKTAPPIDIAEATPVAPMPVVAAPLVSARGPAVKPAVKATPASAGGPKVGPQQLVCFLCGSQFGSSSLRIHIPQCKAKWEAQEAQKPAGQRRPAPSIPPELVGELPKTAKDIQAFNDIMFQEYNTHSLDPCPTCGRTFRPEALAKHMGSCSGLPRRRSQPS